ncbi:Hypothetical protein LUCI_4354 [Lucifera butyrica]|uniref:DUF8173 domain-containing protein n=1 Tax=Lucifera butyrica TaxID=1351585 RepID=A0A498RJ74_9FIRM|nr:hypothetical protein [Lucifera butyrica]VBB09068.1 Hypothetical protein LUCI_4354 [Lucifera butyrica]
MIRFLNRYKLAVLFLLFLSFSVTAFAAPITMGNIISFSDVTVRTGEQVKSVLVVGGDAHINGSVTDELVVVNGNVFLSSTADVRDRVIVLGGKIIAENGAVIHKGFFQYGGDVFAISSLLTAGLIVLIMWLAQFAITAVLLLIPAAMVWLRPKLIGDISQAIRENKLKAVFLGILSILAGLTLIAIFSVSIIGLPLAFLLLLFLAVLAAVGISAVSLSAGESLSQYGNWQEPKKYFNVFLGSLLMALLFNVPVIGLMLLYLAIAAGLGGVCIKLFTAKATANNEDKEVKSK